MGIVASTCPDELKALHSCMAAHQPAVAPHAAVAAMAIPFMGDTKKFDHKDWAILIGLLILVVVLVYVFLLRKRSL
jgi:hypothetical protein